MTLRDIINKEFEVITEEARKEKKVVKIFYKLNLNLIKPAQAPEQPEQQDNEVNNQQPEQQQMTRLMKEKGRNKGPEGAGRIKIVISAQNGHKSRVDLDIVSRTELPHEIPPPLLSCHLRW